MKLQNEYGVLTKDERRSLFLQAASRGDTQETQAIITASPRVETTLIDFYADVQALMSATLLHCLGQANSFSAIRDLWEDRDNDESFLCARLLASQFVVKEKAWQSICQEYGVDYDKLLTNLGGSMYLYSAPFFDWVKNLAFTNTEYKISPNETMVLNMPTLEEAIKTHRETIAFFGR